jgi:hypothetical protein
VAEKNDERKLTLLGEFNINRTSLDSSIANQLGYQKVDALTVLERKLIPLLPSPTKSDHGIVRTDVYDFNNFTVTSYTLHIVGDEQSLSETSRDFSAVEGKQSIRDAHRALCDLGGTPPSLDEIMGYIIELRKDVTIAPPLRLKSPKP